MPAPDLRSGAALVKAVIFDVDGTLYEQGPMRRAMAMRLARAHVLHPVRGVRTMRVLRAYRDAQEALRATPGRDDLAEAQRRLTAESTGVDREEVGRCVAHWMDEAPLDLLARYRRPGLDEALSALRSWGIRLGVLSDYPAEPKLQALGIAGYFDVVLCAEQPEIGVFKPHPRGLQVAVNRLGVDPADALYVGDRIEVDAAAAAAAEIPCAILTGRREAVPGEGFVRIASFREMQESLEPR